MRSLRVLSLLAALAIGGCAAPIEQAVAPAPACRLPAKITPAPERTPPVDEVVKDVPTAFYMLALTWTPEWCRERAHEPDQAFQCAGDNDFGFVLHGLWPNGAGKRHPRFCGPAPALDAATVREHLCMTPSAELLQHEWAAHGTCGWSDPKAYFAEAAALWNTITPPKLKGPTMTGAEIRTAFVRVNPGIPRDAVFLRVVDGDALQDIRICYDLKYRPLSCPGGVGAPDGAAIAITPRRSR